MRRRRFLAGLSGALALVFALQAVAGPKVAPAPTPRPTAAQAQAHAREQSGAAALVAASGLSGSIGYIVIDLASGAVLEEGDADLPLPPASVAKIPTALYALNRLGPTHRFTTRLAAAGPVSGGVLKGDLILEGGGDPELDSDALGRLWLKAAATGLKRVDGRFLVDGGALPQVSRIDPTQPDFASYDPGVSGLNLNFNRVHAEWRRRSGGYDMSVEARSKTLSPLVETATVSIVDSTRDNAVFDFDGAGAVERWRVRRSALGAAGSRWLPVRRPAIYAGSVLRALAASGGLSLPAPADGQTPPSASTIAEVSSRPLTEIVADMLHFSTNLTAEVLGLSASRAGGDGSVAGLGASAQAMNRWAAGYGGFPVGDPGFRMVNHSGLSADSHASARRIAQLLVAAERRTFPGANGERRPTLSGLLPTKRHLDDKAATPLIDAEVRAKTGTLNFASALAGYIEPVAGRRLVFAIITADLRARSNLADPSAERPQGATSWANRSRRLQRALLRSWIDRFAAPNARR